MQAELNQTLFDHCRDGHLKQAQYVFDLGAEINAKTTETIFIPLYKNQPHDLSDGIEIQEDVTPLITAIDHGHLDIAAWLIEEGANLHYNTGHSTPIHRAIRKGDIAMLALLVEYEADVNFDAMMDSPLMLAIQLKEYAMVQFLLDNGANPETENILGLSAKSLAQEMHDPELQKIFDPKAAEKARLEALKTPASDFLRQKWQNASTPKPHKPKRRVPAFKKRKGFGK